MHSYSTCIRWQDIDAAGVVFYSHIFTLMHEAYEDMMHKLNFPLQSIVYDNWRLPLIHAECDFTAPLFLGDQIVITIELESSTGSTFALRYQIYNNQSEIVAKGKTVHTAINVVQNTKINLPEELVSGLNGLNNK
jgi:1,4-dihydroxy-2-naphthoyl-CoA hydrolase